MAYVLLLSSLFQREGSCSEFTLSIIILILWKKRSRNPNSTLYPKYILRISLECSKNIRTSSRHSLEVCAVREEIKKF